MERYIRAGWKKKQRAPVLSAGNVGHYHDPEELALRFAERDARLKADTRTDAERWLGDPPPWQSALAQAKPEHVADAMLIGAAIGGALRRIIGEPDAKMRREQTAQTRLTPGRAPSTPSNRVCAPRYVRQNGPNRARSSA
jgi:hypothetical protein